MQHFAIFRLTSDAKRPASKLPAAGADSCQMLLVLVLHPSVSCSLQRCDSVKVAVYCLLNAGKQKSSAIFSRLGSAHALEKVVKIL